MIKKQRKPTPKDDAHGPQRSRAAAENCSKLARVATTAPKMSNWVYGTIADLRNVENGNRKIAAMIIACRMVDRQTKERLTTTHESFRARYETNMQEIAERINENMPI